MEFNELIKNFERVRTYMKDFFIYGFKSRNEFTQKSARTYDNERRRIENYLKQYIQYQQQGKEKAVFISTDSHSVFENPLYAVWKSKSFTDYDLCLHFYLPALLLHAHTADELADQIAIQFQQEIDPQVIRLKLKEYEQLEIFEAVKKGRKVYYHLAPQLPLEALSAYTQLLDSLTFFQEAAPLGMIGSTILDRSNRRNEYFSFKHHFLTHTLDDEILMTVLQAIQGQRQIHLFSQSKRRDKLVETIGVPLKILVSTQTGRRYLCLYVIHRRRYLSLRLDTINKVILMAPFDHFSQLQENLYLHLPKCWGVTFGNSSRLEHIQFTLKINRLTEAHILHRLEREGRGGKVHCVAADTYQYDGHFYDTNEMLPWIKTFTGRIISIEGSNSLVIHKIKADLALMYQMYFGSVQEDSDGYF